MNVAEKIKFDRLYRKQQLELKLQGKSKKTIESYSRAVRRVADYFNRCPDTLTSDELKLSRKCEENSDSHSMCPQPEDVLF